MAILTTQREVLDAMQSQWPFIIRVATRGKPRPFLFRAQARYYDRIRERVFDHLRRKRIVEITAKVRTSNLQYNDYGLAPKKKMLRPKRRKKLARPKRKLTWWRDGEHIDPLHRPKRKEKQ